VATMATATTWEQLQTTVAATPRAQFLEEQKALREVGAGLPHQDCKLRLFGAKEEDVRLTIFRDHAGWCPYCQKVWMMCEEKQIPYKIEKINMRSYGDKPEWFLKKVPSGLLPVIELDGKIITESLVIMQIIENEFPNSVKMIPTDDNDFDFANELMRLERQLFSDWCGLVFRPSGPGLFGIGGGSGGPRKKFETTLDKVNEALGQRPGPWFLGGDKPSLVDLQYVSHVERMVASCLATSSPRSMCGERGSSRSGPSDSGSFQQSPLPEMYSSAAFASGVSSKYPGPYCGGMSRMWVKKSLLVAW